jgi:hypothetical protein
VENVLEIKKSTRLGMVTHACNPSYSGGTDWEDHSLRKREKVSRPHLNQ